jgi:hypothetical protein
VARRAWLAVALLVIAGCGSGSGAGNAAPEHTLAVLDGDPATQAQFAQILDRFQNGGVACQPDPDRQHAANLISASWQRAGKPGTLLTWASSLVAMCH